MRLVKFLRSVGTATISLEDQPEPEHGCSERADFFGGYECFCGESFTIYHEREVGLRS